MKKNGSQYILFVVFLIFGIVLSVQIKSTLNAKKTSSSKTITTETVKQQIIEVQKEIDSLKAEIDDELIMRNDIINEYINLQNNESLSSEWENIRLATGLVDVKGPGITITLNDAEDLLNDVEVRYQLIHDGDIQTILNELKIAGAQAISVNGERIVPMSEQLCAGPTIRINGNRYPVPYYIEAIGDPDKLYEAMNNSTRIAWLRIFNKRVDIKKEKELKLSKFSGYDNLDRYLSGLEVVK
jgi:uncharacterized protein YlxW (UPF0749 family)